MDEIIRAVSADGTAKISAISARGIVERARLIHGTSPTATAALGRSLCATSLLGDLLKEEDASLTVRINGGGPIGTIMTVSDSGGNVRGYAQNPQADAPRRADGKLNVGAVVGTDGQLTVSRDLGMGEPYVGSTALVSGEIAEDYTAYYCESEQVPAACGLGVLVAPDRSVAAAGGFLVQLLPGAPESAADALEKNIAAMPPVTSILSGAPADAVVAAVLAGLGAEILERHPVEYRCRCSREKVLGAISSVGAAALEEMAASREDIRVSCQFCDAEYVFAPEEIAGLARRAADAAKKKENL